MKPGRKKKVIWKDWEADLFSLEDTPSDLECGAYALHVLTKQPYNEIMKLSKGGHWPTKVMLNFLKKHGHGIIPITLGSMVSCHSIKSGKPQLSSLNVILIDQEAYKEESTWTVIYDGKQAHSGVIQELDALEFLNWPIHEAFLITHPSWKGESKEWTDED